MFILYLLSVGYTIQNNNKTNSTISVWMLLPVGYTIQNNNKTNLPD